MSDYTPPPARSTFVDKSAAGPGWTYTCPAEGEYVLDNTGDQSGTITLPPIRAGGAVTVRGYIGTLTPVLTFVNPDTSAVTTLGPLADASFTIHFYCIQGIWLYSGFVQAA